MKQQKPKVKSKTLQVRIPEDLFKKLKRMCPYNISDGIREALEKFVRDHY